MRFPGAAGVYEYRHRYLVHGTIYTLGVAAPWHLPVWGFLRNESCWFLLADWLSRPGFQNFALYWNLILGGMVLFAAAGAGLRVWGAAYLGATTVNRGSMEGDRVIANGPYRYTRNPLYLGTILNTVAIAMLMRPEAAIAVLILIVLVQYRLIFREEPYLEQSQDSAYLAYKAAVPRLLPSMRARAVPSPQQPDWVQGLLSEVYVLGCAFAMASAGWTSGYGWETSILRVLQGLVISLGLAVVARAFIPKSQF